MSTPTIEIPEPQTRRDETPTPPRLAYSIDETADVLGISRRYVYELFRTGQLDSIKIGSRRLVRVTDIESFLARQEPVR